MAWTHPPPLILCSGGGQRAGLLPDLVRQVEPPGQESQRARLLERKGERKASEPEERLEVRAQEGRGEREGVSRQGRGGRDSSLEDRRDHPGRCAS